MVLRSMKPTYLLLLGLLACRATPSPDCTAMCDRLQGCGYLPSVLGAQSIDPSVDPVSSCQDRCKLSSDLPQYTEIQDCSGEKTCADVAKCLHAAYQNTPITGTSRVVLLTSGTPLLGSADAGAVAFCGTDGGSPVAFANGFMEYWGARQYAGPVDCDLPLRQAFENVPANIGVHMGFQISQGTSCLEYAVQNDVTAGQDPLKVIIDFDAEAAQCAPMNPVAPDAGNGAAVDAGGG